MTVTVNTVYYNATHSQAVPLEIWQQLAPPSPERRIWDIVRKIFRDVWRTISSYFQSISMDASLRARIHLASDPRTNVYLQFTVENLRMKRCLSNVAFVHCIDYLVESYTSDIVLIPVGVKKNGVRHAIAIVYDPKKNRIEFFDPLGLTIRDNLDASIDDVAMREVMTKKNYVLFFDTVDATIVDILVEIKKKYGNSETTIWENTVVHQNDCHNCVLYTLNYFEERLKEKSAEEIAADPCPYEVINDYKRGEWIERLTMNLAPNLPVA